MKKNKIKNLMKQLFDKLLDKSFLIDQYPIDSNKFDKILSQLR